MLYTLRMNDSIIEQSQLCMNVSRLGTNVVNGISENRWRYISLDAKW